MIHRRAALDLFGPTLNLLPEDGELYDHGRVYGADEAAALFASLLRDVPWRPDELVIAGKPVVTARQVAWFGDGERVYHYSGATKVSLPWTPLLTSVKARVEAAVGSSFNACLLNLYRSGSEGMSWHSDDEVSLGRLPTIASLSLGAVRRFDLRHKGTGRKVSVFLDDGQLIVMAGTTQRCWQHALPKSAKVPAARISLTFRTIGA